MGRKRELNDMLNQQPPSVLKVVNIRFWNGQQHIVTDPIRGRFANWFGKGVYSQLCRFGVSMLMLLGVYHLCDIYKEKYHLE